MAQTAYGVNAPEAVKLWSKQLYEEALKATWVGKFMGDSSNDVLQMKDDTKKGAGDRITFTLRMQLTGDGVSGDGTVEGNEEALVTYTDNLLIDQLRHAVRSAGKMTQQRIPWSIREEAQQGLSDWWAGRFDTAFFNHVCCNTAQADLRYTGANAVVAADSAHRYSVNAHTVDQNLTTGDEFTLSFIDQAVAIAKTSTPVMRPVTVGGDNMYVAVLHTNAVTQLRTNTSAGQWLDIQKAALRGSANSGDVDSNPIFTGALGVYNGVVLHESTRVTLGVNSSTGVAVANTRRNVLMGAQAASIAFGQGDSMQNMDWNEELFDYGNQLGVEAGCIYGLKKTVFNSANFSSIIMPSYTA